MSELEDFEKWRKTVGNGASIRKAYKAGQANAPEKVCEWTKCGVVFEMSCNKDCYKSDVNTHVLAPDYCWNCGGKVTIKSELTVEEQLEAMTKENERLRKRDYALVDQWGDEQLRADTAEKHIAELVDMVTFSARAFHLTKIMRYIKEHNLGENNE